MKTDASPELIIAETQDWLEQAVIGLNLCPFAKAVHIKNQIRYKVSSAVTTEALLEDLMVEMQLLADTSAETTDTTLLIHPDVLTDFLDYNDFLDVADQALVELKLDGILQVASFHPNYQFAGTEPEDITNFTNRTPYPTLHLLREKSVEKAVESYPDPSAIPEKNMETLRNLGFSGWKKLFQNRHH
jgi:hypothetical protein